MQPTPPESDDTPQTDAHKNLKHNAAPVQDVVLPPLSPERAAKLTTFFAILDEDV